MMREMESVRGWRLGVGMFLGLLGEVGRGQKGVREKGGLRRGGGDKG